MEGQIERPDVNPEADKEAEEQEPIEKPLPAGRISHESPPVSIAS
jgi:hypothetical protein